MSTICISLKLISTLFPHDVTPLVCIMHDPGWGIFSDCFNLPACSSAGRLQVTITTKLNIKIVYEEKKQNNYQLYQILYHILLKKFSLSFFGVMNPILKQKDLDECYQSTIWFLTGTVVVRWPEETEPGLLQGFFLHFVTWWSFSSLPLLPLACLVGDT